MIVSALGDIDSSDEEEDEKPKSKKAKKKKKTTVSFLQAQKSNLKKLNAIVKNKASKASNDSSDDE